MALVTLVGPLPGVCKDVLSVVLSNWQKPLGVGLIIGRPPYHLQQNKYKDNHNGIPDDCKDDPLNMSMRVDKKENFLVHLSTFSFDLHLQKEKLMNAIKTQNYQTKIKTSDKVKYSGRVFTTTYR